MIKRHMYWLFIVINFYGGCINSKREWEKLNETNKFICDTPYASTRTSKGLDFIRDSLKLDTLQKGYNGLQIRIWYGYSFTHRQQVIVIKNRAGTWSGNYYQFNPVYYKGSDSLLYFKQQMTLTEPDISWEDFMDKLFKQQILILPDASKIGKYDIANDCSGVEIEVATINEYRLYTYSCIFLNNKKIKEFGEMQNIIDLISHHLKITPLGGL
jgi:hypothetical protein